jgi:hypothetical protein
MTSKRIAAAVLLAPIVGVSIACSALPSLGGGSADIPLDTSAEVLFSDAFSDPNSGWDRVQREEGITDYDRGTYRILVNQPQHDYWANPGRSFGDVRVDVDATKAGGPDDNDFGVICRYQDAQNFYAFLVSSDGFYGILKYSDGGSEALGTDGMAASDAIRQGKATNQLRVECVGDELRLFANGELVHSVTDSSFGAGDVGLIAGTYDTSGTDIRFDNFVVYQP